jgi:hypothetical protein
MSSTSTDAAFSLSLPAAWERLMRPLRKPHAAATSEDSNE